MRFSADAREICAFNQNKPDTYFRFRKCFSLKKMPQQSARLFLAAEGEMKVQCNGTRLPVTQFPSWQKCRYVSEVDLLPLLSAGENCLCITLHHYGVGCFSRQNGVPGFIAELRLDGKTFLVSDTSWKTSPDPGYEGRRARVISRLLGLSFAARNDLAEPEESLSSCDDSAWEAAIPALFPDGVRPSYEMRPLPFLQESAPLPVSLLEKKGCSLSSCGKGVSISPQEKILTIDLGREETGFFRIELDSPRVFSLEIHHGEHLADGHVRSDLCGSRYIDTLTVKEGKQSFLHPFRRFGARYLELHLPERDFSFTLFYAGLVPVHRETPERTAFYSSETDPREAELRETALHTLECCTHDHYEDCPWREQALYAYDSRNEMLFDYFTAKKNWRFAAASLELLRQGEFSARQLMLCAPSEADVYIPAFSLVWISALRENTLFSGDEKPLKKAWPTVKRLLAGAMENPAGGNLYAPTRYDGMWDFYEWTGALSKMEKQPHLLYQCYLMEALRSGAEIALVSGEKKEAAYYTERAEAIAGAVRRRFWRNTTQCYHLFADEPDDAPKYEHCQVLPLFLGIVPPRQKKILVAKILRDEFPRSTFSLLVYLGRALEAEGAEARSYLQKRFQNTFYPLIDQGATSLWETPKGEADFSGAASLCHAWSCVTLWFDGAVRLGIWPLAAGFSRFRFDPFLGKDQAISGEVSTPAGLIRVELKKITSRVSEAVLSYPGFLECVFPGNLSVVSQKKGEVTLRGNF